MATLYLLNLADYLTTIYALENIPIAYESNPLVQTIDAIFKAKVIYGTAIGIFGIFCSFTFERLRQHFTSKFSDACYILLLLIVSAVVFHYILVVTGNINVILRYG